MYQLVAFDMDGTLLNDRKQIQEKTLAAVDRAVKGGKTVVLNTGRCPSQLKDFLDSLPGVRYLNCISGAIVYDRAQEKPIFIRELDRATIEQLFQISELEDTMLDLLSMNFYAQRNLIDVMEKYNMAIYKDMYLRSANARDNLKASYFEERFPVSKFNIFHRDPEARSRSRGRIEEMGLDVCMADAEISSLEISPHGIHKGVGLLELCEHLGISPEEMIVVGDADNDLMAMKCAGLSVAMANANEAVKKMADVMVGDNNHDGCAEVIDRYLLG